MASVMGINKIGLPKLSENMDPEDARALRSYLYQMQEQLQYVLSNLDVENMSDEMRTKLQNLEGKDHIWQTERKRTKHLPLCRRRRRAAASLPCRAAIRQRDWTAARRWKTRWQIPATSPARP